MLDMSWGEVMLIGGVALIVIGPKDLPKALRTVGQITTKLRRMAGEFQMQFNEAIREAELDEVRKGVDGVRDTVRKAGAGFNPVQTIRDELKGAVEARVTAPVHGPVQPGAAPPADSVPASPVPEALPPAPPAGPARAYPKPADRLADATAQLRAAEQEAAHAADRSSAHPAPSPSAPAPDPNPPLPVPGSVDDPYGMPVDPPEPPARAAQDASAR